MRTPKKAKPWPADELGTVEQAARFVHVSTRTLADLVRDKEVSYYKLANRLYFRRADLAQYIERQRVEAGGAK